MPYARWSLIATLILGHLIVDLFVPQLLYHGPGEEWLFVALLGLCIGQVNLIAVWAALAPGRVLLRLPWSILLATLMWYALIIGNRLRTDTPFWGGPDFPTEVALQLGLVILAGVTVAQIPLWAASRLLRWRLIPPDRGSCEIVDERQINLKHLLVGMFIVSIVLALGRFVLPPGPIRVAELDRELTVLLPVVTVVNLIVVLPCIWGAFASALYIAPLAIVWLIFAVVVSVVEVAVLIALLGSGPPDDIWMAMSVFNISQCVAVLVTLLCLRGMGFRLVRLDTLPKPNCEILSDLR